MNNDEIQENDDNDIPELVSADEDNEDNHESIPSDDTSFLELYDEIFNEVLENAISEYLNAMMMSNRHIMTSNVFTDTILNNNRTYEQVLQESFETQPEIEKTDHIVEIESYNYSEIKNKIDDKDCCICLCDFDDDCEVCILMCNHILHKDCMIEWGKYRQSCPVCREEV